jgi:deazaflavin-dependent oxidoreductase (nitroreductase family)
LDDLGPLARLAREQFCYLTTIGRRTGKGHTIEIWFALSSTGKTLYMLSGGRDRSDWVKNIVRNPAVEVRIADRVLGGRARVVEDPDEERTARRLVVAKYYGREQVRSTGWEAESLPVAVDLEG